MAKRINRTYKGVLTKRWKERERVKQKVRVLFFITFLLIARIAMADTTVITPEPQEAVSEEPPISDWTPEGLNVVTNDREELVKANLYRDEVKIPVEVKPEPVRAKPQAVTYPLPENEAKAYIYQHESGNNPYAINPSSGACGIGQALPCSKMDCELGDYECQDRWFTNYMINRYGTWANAQQFWLKNHWW